MHIRDYGVQIKAVGTADGLNEGEFEAIVSAFGNVDSYGDRVMPGAFAEDVARWKSGEPLPILWSHKWDDPFAHIGVALDAKEVDRGLYVKGATDLDNPTAVQVQRLLKARRVKQFSFAYDVLDGGEVEEEVEADGEKIKRSVFELRKLRTHEVGPCLLGVNQETELLSAKAANLAAGVLAGREVPKAGLVSLKAAVDALREVITLHSVYPDPEPETHSQTDDPPAADDPAEDKTDPPARRYSRDPRSVDLMFL